MNETIRSRRQEWSYMASEVFQTRYSVAANYLRDCNHILEVGGCSTPITNYLDGAHESVTVVDPLVEPKSAIFLRQHFPSGYTRLKQVRKDKRARNL